MAKEENSGYKKQKPKFVIEPFDRTGGVNYTIRYQGKRPTGSAGIDFKKVSATGDKTRAQAISLGLSESDMIAEIGAFYPNGKTGSHDLTEIAPYMRQGVGSKVLDRIARDARAHGARAIFVETGQDSMKSFLREKKKYQEFEGEKPYLSYFCKTI